MKKSGPVLTLVVCCALGLGVVGCGGQATTTTTAVPTTTTTAAANTWTNLNPTGDLPSPRSGCSMAYDSAGGQVILFGGSTGGKLLNDTWAYDPAANTWTNLHPAGSLPSGGYNCMVYDAADGKVILFTGFFNGRPLNDTWAYDPAANTWTNLHPAGSLPSGADNCMVYDSARGKAILFAGGDTWAYDPAANTWTNLHAAGGLAFARYSAAMAYDPADGKVILFGGMGSNGCLNDTWAYDPVANTWTKLNPSGVVPSGRYGHSMTYDPAGRKVILFGGGAPQGPGVLKLSNDTWAYDPGANSWTQLNPPNEPPARYGAAMVYDPMDNRMFLCAGMSADNGTMLGDTWAYTP